jgi:isochorismate hydrolase
MDKYIIPLDSVIDSDPTLRYLIRDAQFDFDLLEHQMSIRCAALKIAIGKWLDINYN